MTDLADFLLARIAEDKAAATDEAIARATAGTVVGGPGVSDQAVEQAQEGVRDLRRVRPWSSPLGPARVLTECEAKRRIVEWCSERNLIQVGLLGSDPTDPANYIPGDYAHATDAPVLRLLAVPYADHPDYREEWKP